MNFRTICSRQLETLTVPKNDKIVCQFSIDIFECFDFLVLIILLFQNYNYNYNYNYNFNLLVPTDSSVLCVRTTTLGARAEFDALGPSEYQC